MTDIESYFSALCGRLDWEFAGFTPDLTQELAKQDELNLKPVLGIHPEMDIYHKLLMEEAFPSRIEMPGAASGDTRFWVFTLLLTNRVVAPSSINIVTDLAYQTRDYFLGNSTRVLLGNSTMNYTKSNVLFQIRIFIPLNESFEV